MISRRLPRSIRGRLAFTYGVLTIVIMLGLGSLLVWANRGRFEDQVESQLRERAQMIAAVVADDLRANAPLPSVDARIKRMAVDAKTRLTLVAPDGVVVGDSDGEPGVLPGVEGDRVIAEAIVASLAGDETTRMVKRDGKIEVLAPVPGGTGYVIRASESIDVVDSTFWRLQRDVVLIAVTGTILAVAAALIVASRITRPLDELRRHSAMVANGQLQGAVNPDDTLELGDLARSFNLMTRRLRDLVTESDRSRARLEAIFSNLSDGVVVVDPTLNVVALNDAAAKLAGVSRAWAVDKQFVVVVRDSDLRALVQKGLESGQTQTASIDYLRTGHFLDAVVQPFTSGGQRLTVVVLRDVTELRRLESVRREFVANVSHELRTPLASIRALVETLEAGAIDDPEVSKPFLGRVVGEVDRLTALVDELLDLARLESGRLTLNLQAVRPNELIAGGVDRLRPQIERGRLSLDVQIDPDLPLVSADRPRIEQVLLNLIHNAIKFTPPGGTIRVDAVREAESIAISVRDTGSGIPAGELTRVFERFYKSDKARRSDGTGLGLAITKHIVLAHGGTIHASSEPGLGATFTFTLPVAANVPNLASVSR